MNSTLDQLKAPLQAEDEPEGPPLESDAIDVLRRRFPAFSQIVNAALVQAEEMARLFGRYVPGEISSKDHRKPDLDAKRALRANAGLSLTQIARAEFADRAQDELESGTPAEMIRSPSAKQVRARAKAIDENLRRLGDPRNVRERKARFRRTLKPQPR